MGSGRRLSFLRLRYFPQLEIAPISVVQTTISGAGPSVFAWFEDRASAESAAPAMQSEFAAAGFASQAYVAPIAGPAAGLVGA